LVVWLRDSEAIDETEPSELLLTRVSRPLLSILMWLTYLHPGGLARSLSCAA
jgi:hypothetical protein